MNEATSGYVQVDQPRQKCHGCEGKGWVEVSQKPFKCVVCDGEGLKKFAYHPPLVTEYVPFQQIYGSPNCSICGQKNCTITHISCTSSAHDIMGNPIQQPVQSIMRLESRC